VDTRYKGLALDHLRAAVCTSILKALTYGLHRQRTAAEITSTTAQSPGVKVSLIVRDRTQVANRGPYKGFSGGKRSLGMGQSTRAIRP
jgi:hypothetical protein